MSHSAGLQERQHEQTPESAIELAYNQPIAPCSVITKDISYIPAWEMERPSLGIASSADRQDYKKFVDSLSQVCEPFMRPQVTASIARFMLHDTIASPEGSSNPGVVKEGVVEFHDNGVTFLSSDPEDYCNLHEYAYNFGKVGAAGLITFLQQLTASPGEQAVTSTN